MMYKGFSILDGVRESLHGAFVHDNLRLRDVDELVQNVFAGLNDLMIRHAVISALAPKIVELELEIQEWWLRNPDGEETPNHLFLREAALKRVKENLAGEFIGYELDY